MSERVPRKQAVDILVTVATDVCSVTPPKGKGSPVRWAETAYWNLALGYFAATFFAFPMMAMTSLCEIPCSR